MPSISLAGVEVQAQTQPNSISLSGVIVTGPANEIVSVSGGAANSQVTINSDGTTDLTAAAVVSVLLEGVALSGVAVADADTVTAQFPIEGYELGSSVDIVLIVDGAASAPYGVIFDPALGGFTTLTVDYSGLHPDSPLLNPAYSGLVVGDQVEFSPISSGGFPVSVDGNGYVTVTGAGANDGDQLIDFALIDASDDFARSNVSTWTLQAPNELLVIHSSTQGQSAGNVALSQLQALTISSSQQQQTTENVSIAESNDLVIHESLQAQGLDNATLSQFQALIVDSSEQQQAIENVSISDNSTLVVDGIGQQQAIEHLTQFLTVVFVTPINRRISGIVN